ncbi:hypothetical protein PtB15_17B204 [Puccinia triticina]|nr:hypothetical protein PtB15_17B204 [Puccinia triticina]
MSSKLSFTTLSANQTANTSLMSADYAQADTCGLTGIGVRNRRCIYFYSLRKAEHLTHPAMHYVPSSFKHLQ